MASTKPARGMRDFLPSDVRKREYVIGIIKEVYQSYGFEPLETPAVENIETLLGKYGEEGNQLIFKILKRGEKLDESLETRDRSDLADLALRYDLTVPLARVVANNKNDLPKFFKRYQIQPVWRADRPARGRFREFYQCDVDAIGSSSMVVEAEIISAACEILEMLGFADFTVRINHRDVLTGILDSVGLDKSKHLETLVALDKLDKIGFAGVSKELSDKNIKSESSEKLLRFFELFFSDNWKNRFNKAQAKKILDSTELIEAIKNAASDRTKGTLEILYKLKELRFPDEISPAQNAEFKRLLSNFVEIKKFEIEGRSFWDVLLENMHEEMLQTVRNYESYVSLVTIGEFLEANRGVKGTLDLNRIVNRLDDLGCSSRVKIDPTLARGLSYYTGAIMEINVPDLAGSLGGGGRYDGLIGMFGKEQIPACGFSLGLERILVVMEERGMFPPEITASNAADVMVTIWNEDTIGESLKLASELRKHGLRVAVYPEADKLGKQFKYASQINVPFVCVIGDSEIAGKKVSLKDMASGEQELIGRKDIAARIRK